MTEQFAKQKAQAKFEITICFEESNMQSQNIYTNIELKRTPNATLYCDVLWYDNRNQVNISSGQ